MSETAAAARPFQLKLQLGRLSVKLGRKRSRVSTAGATECENQSVYVGGSPPAGPGDLLKVETKVKREEDKSEKESEAQITAHLYSQ